MTFLEILIAIFGISAQIYVMPSSLSEIGEIFGFSEKFSQNFG